MNFIKVWIVKIGLHKAVASAAKLIASYAVSHGIKVIAGYHGWSINLQDEAGLVLVINSGLKVLEHNLAAKYPSLSWLVDLNSLPDAPNAAFNPAPVDTVPPEIKP